MHFIVRSIDSFCQIWQGFIHLSDQRFRKFEGLQIDQCSFGLAMKYKVNVPDTGLGIIHLACNIFPGLPAAGARKGTRPQQNAGGTIKPDFNSPLAGRRDSGGKSRDTAVKIITPEHHIIAIVNRREVFAAVTGRFQQGTAMDAVVTVGADRTQRVVGGEARGFRKPEAGNGNKDGQKKPSGLMRKIHCVSLILLMCREKTVT